MKPLQCYYKHFIWFINAKQFSSHQSNFFTSQRFTFCPTHPCQKGEWTLRWDHQGWNLSISLSPQPMRYGDLTSAAVKLKCGRVVRGVQTVRRNIAQIVIFAVPFAAPLYFPFSLSLRFKSVRHVSESVVGFEPQPELPPLPMSFVLKILGRATHCGRFYTLFLHMPPYFVCFHE
jgi:hypothetical protein